MWIGHLQSAIASLRAARWRSTLTMLGIVIGISSVVTIFSLGEGLKQQITGQINQLEPDVLTVRSGKLVESESSAVNLRALFTTSTLTEADITALSELQSVEAVVPIAFITSSVSSSQKTMNNAFVGGSGYEIERMLNQKVDYGSFFDSNRTTQRFAVIGTNVALTLFDEYNPVGKTLTVNKEDFIVRGVLSQSSGGLLSLAGTDFNSAVFLPYETAKNLTDSQPNIMQILVKAKSGTPLSQTTKDVKNALYKSHNQNEDFTVLRQDELLNIATSVLNTLTGFISAIAAISLLVGGIGIMNIMLASVSERTREIGVRKAVGATNRQILQQFLTEGMVITIIGGIIGILASIAINLALRLYTGLEPAITLPATVLAVLVSVTLGIIFSVAPAMKAARKDPINALRGE